MFDRSERFKLYFSFINVCTSSGTRSCAVSMTEMINEYRKYQITTGFSIVSIYWLKISVSFYTATFSLNQNFWSAELQHESWFTRDHSHNHLHISYVLYTTVIWFVAVTKSMENIVFKGICKDIQEISIITPNYNSKCIC